MKAERQRDVESDVELGRHLGEVGLECVQGVGDRVQERSDQNHADQPVEQVADRQPVARGIAAAAALEHRIDRAAEVGAEHERQRRRRRHEVRIRQRHDQQHGRDALTWAAHSSVAIVLLIMSLAYSQFITPAAALALVLGANLGSAINPVIEGGRRGDMASYRLPVGNLLNRLVGVVLVAPFLPALAGAFLAFQPDLAKMTAAFHVAFNVALALAFIGLLDPLAWLLEKIFPARKKRPIRGAALSR